MTPENWWLENLFVFGKAYCSAGMLVLAKVVPLEFLKPDFKPSWVFQVFFWACIPSRSSWSLKGFPFIFALPKVDLRFWDGKITPQWQSTIWVLVCTFWMRFDVTFYIGIHQCLRSFSLFTVTWAQGGPLPTSFTKGPITPLISGFLKRNLSKTSSFFSFIGLVYPFGGFLQLQ